MCWRCRRQIGARKVRSADEKVSSRGDFFNDLLSDRIFLDGIRLIKYNYGMLFVCGYGASLLQKQHVVPVCDTVLVWSEVAATRIKKAL